MENLVFNGFDEHYNDAISIDDSYNCDYADSIDLYSNKGTIKMEVVSPEEAEEYCSINGYSLLSCCLVGDGFVMVAR